MYKYEIHIHSKACSACSNSTAEEMVMAAKEQGYAGIFFSNHFYRGNTAIDRSLPWAEFVEAYRQDYLAAKAFGEKIGVDVFFGLEEGIGSGKEVLIYGISPETVANEPSFPRMSLKELSQFVRSRGGLIAAAHPFRDRDYIQNPDQEPDPELLDAIEVYNHFNTDETNAKAKAFAEKTGLIKISGGDIHSASNFGVAGVAFPYRISSDAEFVNAIKNREFKYIVCDKLFEP